MGGALGGLRGEGGARWWERSWRGGGGEPASCLPWGQPAKGRGLPWEPGGSWGAPPAGGGAGKGEGPGCGAFPGAVGVWSWREGARSEGLRLGTAGVCPRGGAAGPGGVTAAPAPSWEGSRCRGVGVGVSWWGSRVLVAVTALPERSSRVLTQSCSWCLKGERKKKAKTKPTASSSLKTLSSYDSAPPNTRSSRAQLLGTGARRGGGARG